jgi:polyphosphate kinase
MSETLPPFDLDNPVLPKWLDKQALASGGFPYDERLKGKTYAKELEKLQLELVKLQAHLQKTGGRMVIVFEGRDAAGKGGAIKAYSENLNPRLALDAALPKPSDREKTQWYFQRYVDWLPAAGETILFDRSWYNRAGVEPVMGFCTPEQTEAFLSEAPRFEKMLVRDGIMLFKFWLAIGRETQLKRFHARRHDPLKVWKISPIDHAAMEKWDDYSKAAERMFEACHNDDTPWHVVLANDKYRARLELIRTVLGNVDFEGRDSEAIGEVDEKIVMAPKRYLSDHAGA